MASAVRAHSIGQISLRSADPTQRPLLDPNYLSAAVDVETLLRSLKALCQRVTRMRPRLWWRKRRQIWLLQREN